jgi:hypothetical protein
LKNNSSSSSKNNTDEPQKLIPTLNYSNVKQNYQQPSSFDIEKKLTNILDNINSTAEGSSTSTNYDKIFNNKKNIGSAKIKKFKNDSSDEEIIKTSKKVTKKHKNIIDSSDDSISEDNKDDTDNSDSDSDSDNKKNTKTNIIKVGLKTLKSIFKNLLIFIFFIKKFLIKLIFDIYIIIKKITYLINDKPVNNKISVKKSKSSNEQQRLLNDKKNKNKNKNSTNANISYLKNTHKANTDKLVNEIKNIHLNSSASLLLDNNNTLYSSEIFQRKKPSQKYIKSQELLDDTNTGIDTENATELFTLLK